MFEQLHGRRGEGRAEGNERVNACGGGAVDLEYEEREKTRDCRLAKIEMILLSIQTSMQGKGKGEEGEGRGRGKGEKGKKKYLQERILGEAGERNKPHERLCLSFLPFIDNFEEVAQEERSKGGGKDLEKPSNDISAGVNYCSARAQGGETGVQNPGHQRHNQHAVNSSLGQTFHASSPGPNQSPSRNHYRDSIDYGKQTQIAADLEHQHYHTHHSQQHHHHTGRGMNGILKQFIKHVYC